MGFSKENGAGGGSLREQDRSVQNFAGIRGQPLTGSRAGCCLIGLFVIGTDRKSSLRHKP